MQGAASPYVSGGHAGGVLHVLTVPVFMADPQLVETAPAGTTNLDIQYLSVGYGAVEMDMLRVHTNP